MSNVTHAQYKLDASVRLAKNCARDAWQDNGLDKKQRRECKNISREAMQDARYWQGELRKLAPAKQRMFNVVRVRGDNGNEVQLNATPMTHDEACTFLSKLTKYKWCRDMLVEVPWVDVTEPALVVAGARKFHARA